MKTSLTLRNKYFFLMLFVLILQGCDVYRARTVSLREASQQKTKVKVKTSTDENIKYKHIEYINNKFYGITRKNGEWIKVELYENEIQSVREKNTGLSTFLIIITIGAVALMAPAIAFAAGGGIF